MQISGQPDWQTCRQMFPEETEASNLAAWIEKLGPEVRFQTGSSKVYLISKCMMEYQKRDGYRSMVSSLEYPEWVDFFQEFNIGMSGARRVSLPGFSNLIWGDKMSGAK